MRSRLIFGITRQAWLCSLVMRFAFNIGRLCAIVLLATGLALFPPSNVFSAPPRKAGVRPIVSEKQVKKIETRNTLIVGTKGSDPKPPSPKVETYHQLLRLADAMETGADVTEWLSETAVGSGVWSDQLAVAVENDQLRVEVVSDDAAKNASGPLSDLLKRLQQSLVAGEQVRIEQFAIVEMSPTKFATSAWFESRSDDSTRSCLWEVEWQPNKKGIPIVSRIVGRGYTRTTSLSGGKLFTERTSGVLANGPAVRQLTEFDAARTASMWIRQSGACQSGISVVDVNGDGLDDVFLPQPGGIPNLLFVHQADGTLEEAAKQWGLDWVDATTSGLFVDLDNDGDRDLAVTTDQGFFVLANNGKSFSQKAKLDIIGGAAHATDYDGDGLLDLLVCGAETTFERKRIERPEHLHRQFTRGNLRLFRNQGGLAFSDTTKNAKLPQSGYALAINDVDRNGSPDLFVTQGNGVGVLYTNDGGEFVARDPMSTTTSSAIAWGDLNRDGIDDCFFGNGWPGFLNDVASIDSGADIRLASGNSVLFMGSDAPLASPDRRLNTGWTSSVQFADLDNSGSLDLVALNGFMTSTRTADYTDVLDARKDADDPGRDSFKDVINGDNISGLFRSRAAELVRPTKPSRLNELARMLQQGRSLAGGQKNRVYLNTLDEKHLLADFSPSSGLDAVNDGRGLAMSDWDNDGDLDTWISNRNSPTLQFFENTGGADLGDAVQLELVGKNCNRDAIGATVVLELASGVRLTRTVVAAQAYRSQSTHRVHIGLGKGDQIKALVVRWPLPGKAEPFTGVKAGGTFRLTEGVKEAEPISTKDSAVPNGSALASVAAEAAEDVLLPVRPIFPAISYLTSGEKVRRVEWEPGKPLLLVFWDPECDLCVSELRRLSKLRGLDCIALAPDTPKYRERPASIANQQKFLNAKLDETKGYHKVGFFEDELYDEMRVLHQHLFSQPQTLRFPCSFLIDREGRLAAVYRGQVDLKTVIGHFTKLKLTGRELVSACLPLGGKLVGEPPTWSSGALFCDYLLAGNPVYAERIMAIEQERSPTSDSLLDMKSLLGEMYLGFRKFDKAAVLITEYLEAKPNDAVALNNFGVLFAERFKVSKTREDEQAAEKAWKKACDADENYANAWVNYGTFLMQRNRYEEAEPVAERLLSIAPKSIQAHNMISIIRLKDGKFKEAEGHLKKILEIEPRAFGAYANLSKAYAIQNRLPEARSVLQTALAIEGIDEGSRKGLNLLLKRYGPTPE